MKIFRIKDNLLHLNHLRKFIGNEIFREAINSKFKLEVSDQVPSGRVLVLAPHPDDDVIGCGGAILYHLKNEDPVKVIYLTDGSGGLPQQKMRLAPSEKRELKDKREDEAKQAAQALGLQDLVFWRFADGKFTLNKTTLKLMQGVLGDYRPEIIYAPAFSDPNSDHIETTKLLVEAIKTLGFDTTILSYEVWSPVFANRIVNVEKVYDKKIEALKAHQSQLECRGYFEAIVGLNQYRAGMYNAGKYAEAFFECNKKLYLQLFDLLNLKKD